MEFPNDRLYSEDHLWVKVEQGRASIGITEYAKEELGQVDYVELPQPDDDLTKNEPFGIIETSKAVTDLVAPLSGTVVETNAALGEDPTAVTVDPYGSGWLVRVIPSVAHELDALMEPAAYKKLVTSLFDE